MKKTASVFLLLVFLFNTAGIFGLFSYLKQEHYESVFKSEAYKQNLVRLIIPKSEKLRWEKENEVVYHGKYYDVFAKSEDEKNVFLTCFSDTRDGQMKEALEKQLNEQNESSKEKPGNGNAMKIFTHDYVLLSFVWSVPFFSEENFSVQSFVFASDGFRSAVFSPPDFLV